MFILRVYFGVADIVIELLSTQVLYFGSVTVIAIAILMTSVAASVSFAFVK